MSTWLSARLSTQRIGAAAGKTPSGDVKPYMEAVASLVPAEVLALHAAILSYTTTTRDSVTTITQVHVLKAAFWGMIILSIGLWWGGHIGSRATRLDAARMFIPPIAFVTWTMLQPVSAFDSMWPTMPFASRMVVALFAVVVLLVSAGLLARSDR
jgi:cytochrome b